MSGKVQRTYRLVVRNNRGKVIDERDLVRNSQWSAHGAARDIFRDQPAGSHMTLLLNDKVLEEWTMHGDGWEFEVKNGDSVSAASQSAALPRQRGSQVKASTKVKAGRNVKKAVRTATPKAARAVSTAKAPF